MKRFLQILLLFLYLPSYPLLAATIFVNTNNDAVAVDTFCSLREAIQAANTNLAVNECIAGDDMNDTIDITLATSPINIMGTPLPVITNTVTITGPGSGMMDLSLAVTGQLLNVDSVANNQTVTVSGLRILNVSNTGGNGAGTDV